MQFPRTCVIIPCYNEANRLDIEKIQHYLIENTSVEIVFANDGSTDNTVEVLTNFRNSLTDNTVKKRVHILDFKLNSGKAEVVRKGMLFAGDTDYYQSLNLDAGIQSDNSINCEYYGFWDADLATPLTELNWFYHFIESGESYWLLMGSRVARLGSNINRTFFRHYTGRIFATFISMGLKWKVHDSQCGAKLLQKEFVPIFREPFKTKWLFDVEILLRFKSLHGNESLKHIIEIPIRDWHDVKGSKIKLKDFIKVPYQIWKVFRDYR